MGHMLYLTRGGEDDTVELGIVQICSLYEIFSKHL